MTIKFENTEVLGFDHAIRGMRNPMNSWAKSDSINCAYEECEMCTLYKTCVENDEPIFGFKIGPNDLELMKNLRNSGTDHRKFMRMITVYVDITAPLYWWKEFDTYKVGTVANSCSTMHKIHAKEFTLDDFSTEHMLPETLEDQEHDIERLNYFRKQFLKTKDKVWWWQMIQRLGTNYNQRRTICFNYEVLANMYNSRYNHKQDEWRENGLCGWIKSLPYGILITGGEEDAIDTSD